MRTGSRAYLLVETVVGLSVLAAVVLCMAASSHQYARAMGALSDYAAAHRSAECVLTQLQAGRPAPLDIPETDVRLSAALAPDTAPPEGFVWAVVNVEHHKKRARLVGLAPRGPFDQMLAKYQEKGSKEASKR